MRSARPEASPALEESLFSRPSDQPLAARMRARSLDEYVGQSQILGPGRLLRKAIENDRLFASMVLWGPPGTGKTTLATLIARTTRAHFMTLSAVMAGVADIRKAVLEAQEHRNRGQRTLLLVDEIHRFNKSQQDALLPHVEDGTILLIGATTENPYFEVNKALVSRSRIFRLEALSNADVETLLRRALSDTERGYGSRDLTVDEEVVPFLAEMSGGDGRTALNGLEMAVEAADGHLTLTIAQDAMQRKNLQYDKGGDEHYDTISAFIKSVRGSNPDAALFYLAKMVLAGEDPRFIMRRLLILAGEDIGLANPNGLVVASAAAHALEWVGLPEAKYHLAMATVYLATSAKSNTMGQYFAAEQLVQETREGRAPAHLRDAHYQGAARLGHGKGYRYPHDFPGHYVEQQYLPDELVGRTLYEPSDQGYEQNIRQRLNLWRGRPAPEREPP